MSQIRVNDITDSTGSWSSTPEQIQQGRAKAWVTFNGLGTVAIQNSFNVNSVGDIATGRFSITFATAMPNTDYVYASGVEDGGGYNDLRGWNHEASSTKTTTVFDVYQVHTNLSPDDPERAHIVLFGD